MSKVTSKKARTPSVFEAKIRAAYATARLLALIFGTIGLILACILTSVLSVLFHANAALTFMGSLIACLILAVVVLPVKVIYKSKLSQLCQVEGLYDLADKLAFEELGPSLTDILNGRSPAQHQPNFELALSNVQLLYIRKGELKNALKVSQYLLECQRRGSGDSIYQANTLACLNVEIGKFQEGMSMARANLLALENQGRQQSPASVSALLGLIEGAVETHNIREAEKWLGTLKEKIDSLHGNTCANQTDQIVKIEAGRFEKDMAFYWLLLGKTQTLKGNPEAEKHLESALSLMSKEENRKTLTLLYPEILLALVDLKIRQKRFEEAEPLLEKAIAYYDERTRYRGPAYAGARGTCAYVRFKLGAAGGDCIEPLQSALACYFENYEQCHPRIATMFYRLGETYASLEKFAEADEVLQKALAIREKIFSQSDADIAEVRDLIARLPKEAALSA